jgi:diguanylate cyclase (GGDEF)-like protein
VDDNPSNITILSQLLDSEYEVICADNGGAALALAQSVRPDLILLDVVMPEMDGYEVCKRLKGDPATVDIPVIFVTVLADTDAESRGLELGAMDYITKPFNARTVRRRVRNQVEVKQARDALRSLAATDGLTGLANRRRLDVTLLSECHRSARTKAPLGLIMLDLDQFKPFNDLYGHVAGDDCLRSVAGVIGEAMRRDSDLAARYGGEEFACVLPDADLPGAVVVAERIRAAIKKLAITHNASTVARIITSSIGVISIQCVPGIAADDVLRAADACLYRAKAAGRNRVVAA